VSARPFQHLTKFDLIEAPVFHTLKKMRTELEPRLPNDFLSSVRAAAGVCGVTLLHVKSSPSNLPHPFGVYPSDRWKPLPQP
jgi:hypothetical protein